MQQKYFKFKINLFFFIAFHFQENFILYINLKQKNEKKKETNIFKNTHVFKKEK